MTTVQISKVRERLTALGKRVSTRGERAMVKRRGTRLFALVPVEDVDLLERLEDETDIRLARQAMKERGPSVPLEKVRKDVYRDL